MTCSLTTTIWTRWPYQSKSFAAWFHKRNPRMNPAGLTQVKCPSPSPVSLKTWREDLVYPTLNISGQRQTQSTRLRSEQESTQNWSPSRLHSSRRDSYHEQGWQRFRMSRENALVCTFGLRNWMYTKSNWGIGARLKEAGGETAPTGQGELQQLPLNHTLTSHSSKTTRQKNVLDQITDGQVWQQSQ